MNTHKIVKKHSMIVEAIGILHAIASPHARENMIPTELTHLAFEIKEINFIKNESTLTFVLLEMLLFIEERHHINQFQQAYTSLTDNQLRYCLLSGRYKIELIKTATIKEFELYTKENGIIDTKQFLMYIDSPRTFFDPLLKLVHVVFEHKSFKNMYTTEVMDKIKYHYTMLDETLEKRHPLSYAQSVMGKSFYNIADWDTYEFLYIYTIYPYKLRLMDEHQNIMVITVLDRIWDDKTYLEKIQKQMKLVADPTRMSILKLIYSNPMFGKELAEALSLTTATVSHHLEQMRLEGLIHVERNKNTKYYSTNQRNLHTLMKEVNKYITSL